VSVAGVPRCASAVSGADAACVPFDAFHANNNDADLVDYLFTAQSGTTTGVGTLRDLVASLSGDLGRYGVTSPLAKQGLAVSFGLEYRKEAFDSHADAIYREQNGGEDFSISQSVNEANVEVQAPVIEERRWAHLVQLNGGYRISKYTNNPDRFSTWKTEALWAPVEDFTFRGSYNKAQRAPTVIEVRQASGVSYGTRALEDPCAPGADGIPDASIETCRATGLPDSLYGSPTLNCPDGNCTVKIGGFTADPETAYTKTLGIVVRPRFLRDLVLSADWFDISIDNSLGYNDADYFRNGCIDSGGNPFFCSGIVRNPGTGTIFSTPSSNPATGFYRAGTTNYYKSATRGWDFQGQYVFAFGNGGRLDSSFNGTRTTNAGGQDSPLLPERNCAGYYGNGCGQLVPKWMHSLRTTYTTPNKLLSASINWRHIGSLTHADNSGDPAIGGTPDRARTSYFRFDSADYFDLSFGTNIREWVDLRLVVTNVLDKSAPIMPNSRDISLTYNNSVPQRYDSLGRAISLGVSARF
jgi:iron complex outermembrane receptor protein